MFLKKGSVSFRFCALSVVLFFAGTLILTDLLRIRNTDASELGLPEPTQLVKLSAQTPQILLKGLRFDPENPLKLDFIIDTEGKKIDEKTASRLIRYFLAGLTTKEEKIWVNLSPYESDRIIDEQLSQTDLGKDLLAQDYVLKQLSSSLTHPDTEIGKEYWQHVVDSESMQKIWITPDSANVYENNNLALITDANLKVLTEADFTANFNNEIVDNSDLLRNTLIQKITDDVNSGENFLTLRQVYYSLVLADWFKRKFKESLYRSYIDQGKTNGIDVVDAEVKDKLYELYVSAFKKGVYNIIRKEKSATTGQSQRRRYFSGGYGHNSKKMTLSSSLSNEKKKELINSNFSIVRSDLYDSAESQDLVTSSSIRKEIKKYKRMSGWAIGLAGALFMFSFGSDGSIIDSLIFGFIFKSLSDRMFNFFAVKPMKDHDAKIFKPGVSERVGRTILLIVSRLVQLTQMFKTDILSGLYVVGGGIYSVMFAPFMISIGFSYAETIKDLLSNIGITFLNGLWDKIDYVHDNHSIKFALGLVSIAYVHKIWKTTKTTLRSYRHEEKLGLNEIFDRYKDEELLQKLTEVLAETDNPDTIRYVVMVLLNEMSSLDDPSESLTSFFRKLSVIDFNSKASAHVLISFVNWWHRNRYSLTVKYGLTDSEDGPDADTVKRMTMDFDYLEAQANDVMYTLQNRIVSSLNDSSDDGYTKNVIWGLLDLFSHGSIKSARETRTLDAFRGLLTNPNTLKIALQLIKTWWEKNQEDFRNIESTKNVTVAVIEEKLEASSSIVGGIDMSISNVSTTSVGSSAIVFSAPDLLKGIQGLSFDILDIYSISGESLLN